MTILDFEGFDTLNIGEQLALPPLAEIIRSPFFTRVSAEDLLRHGGEFNKWLFSQANLTNQFSNVCVSVNLKYLTGKEIAMRTTDWHCDGSDGCPYYSVNERFHILIGYTDLVTEFLAQPVSMEVDDMVGQLDHYQFRRYIEENKHRADFKPKSIPKDTFVTFNSKHLHRVPDAPQKPCLRLSMIIRESNFNQSKPIELAADRHSEAWVKGGDSPKISIEQVERGIVLRTLNGL